MSVVIIPFLASGRGGVFNALRRPFDPAPPHIFDLTPVPYLKKQIPLVVASSDPEIVVDSWGKSTLLHSNVLIEFPVVPLASITVPLVPPCPSRLASMARTTAECESCLILLRNPRHRMLTASPAKGCHIHRPLQPPMGHLHLITSLVLLAPTCRSQTPRQTQHCVPRMSRCTIATSCI